MVNNWESLKFIEKLIISGIDCIVITVVVLGMIDYMNNKESCNYYGYDNSIEAYEL